MNAKLFLSTYGDSETERVCKLADTSLVYFKQCIDGKRNFGRSTAEKLEDASCGLMTKVELVFPDVQLPQIPRRENRKAAQ